MTTTISSTTARFSMSGGFIRWLAILANGVATYWRRREGIKALRELDDRQLRDIGIMRCDIKTAVKGVANPDIAQFR